MVKKKCIIFSVRRHIMAGFQRIDRIESGFTMVELISTLALISILVLIAGPAVTDGLSGYRLRAAARDLHGHLQRAKMEAIQSSGECAVYFNADNGQYQIVRGGPDGVCNGPPLGHPPVPQNDDVLLKHICISDYGSGVAYGSGDAKRTVPGSSAVPVFVSYANNWIRFNSKGMAREMGYVYLTNSEGSAYAVGTPSFAGAIVLKKCFGSTWK